MGLIIIISVLIFIGYYLYTASSEILKKNSINGNTKYLRNIKANIFTYYTIMCKNRNIKPKQNLSLEELLKEIEFLKKNIKTDNKY